MKLSDFYHLSVPGDGGCFFHSIVAILEVEEKDDVVGYKFSYEKDSMNLRKKCVSWLRKNLDYEVKGTGLSIRMEIDDAINDEAEISERDERDPRYSSVNEYLKYISDNDAYAGQIEIYAVSELLKRNIRVFTSKNKTQNAILKNLGLGYEINNSSEKDIFLYHNFGKKVSAGSHHFEALIPKKNIKGAKKHKSTRTVKRKQTQRRVDRRTVKRKQTQRRVDRRTVKRKQTQRRVDRRRTQRQSVRRVDRRRTQRPSVRRVDRRKLRPSVRRVDRRRTQRQSVRRVDRRRTPRPQGQGRTTRRKDTRRNTKRQKGGMEPLLVETDPQTINPSSDSEEYEDLPSRPWHSRRLRGISSSSEDSLTPLPSPTPNEVGYIHPELGSPDEDIPLHFKNSLARVKNFRLAIYKNKHDDGIIKIDNQIEGLNFNLFCGLAEGNRGHMIAHRIFFGTPQEVIAGGVGPKGGVFQTCSVRDALGNRILTLKASGDRKGMGDVVEPIYDVTFNIPESDENGTYVIYQK